MKGWATAAVFCVLATPGALAQKAAPPANTASEAKAPAESAKVWPRLLPGRAEAHAEPAWSPQDVAAAQARCTALLRSLDVVAVPEEPLREGAGCGTPAPMKLISVGKNPQIALSPPPTVTCDMIAAMHTWLQREVQPLARKHLGAPVIRVETMSSYSCRNAYGLANGRLSEHGRANAIDISGFVTAKGNVAKVVADWGMTSREIKAAAAQGAADPAPAAQPAAPSPARPAAPRIIAAGAAPIGLGSQPGLGFSIPGLTIDVTSSMGLGLGMSPELGLAPPSRLGGPKAAAAKTAAAPVARTPDADGRMDFLRGTHRAACKVFGTVLGPEANNAHKNHFHVDMAQRKSLVICE